GVVAALTLPNLNSSTGDKEKVAKVKKIYSNLNDAFGRAQAVYGPYDEWCQNVSTNKDCSKKVGERLTEFMKISKTCGLEKNKGCFSDKTYFMDKSGYDSGEDTYDDDYKVIVSDRTSLSFYKAQNDQDIYIYVDIDGPIKGESTYGKDFFGFMVDNVNKGVFPVGEGSTGNLTKNIFYDCTSTAWVINNGNMDYLKTDISGKCPNGTQLNWTNQTSCK
ncbi:hypothetical protein IJ707_02060, partial [bacterium]|nr:hypothetical protein [bacterium]